MRIPQITVEIGDFRVRMTADYDQRCVNVEADQYDEHWCYVCVCLFKYGPQQMAKEIMLHLFEAESLDQIGPERPCYASLCDVLTLWIVTDRDLHMFVSSATELRGDTE